MTNSASTPASTQLRYRIHVSTTGDMSFTADLPALAISRLDTARSVDLTYEQWVELRNRFHAGTLTIADLPAEQPL